MDAAPTMKSMRIFLEQFRIETKIGINPGETTAPQTLLIDAWLTVERATPREGDALSPVQASDSVTRSVVGYDTLADAIERAASRQDWALVEDFAEHIAALCLQDSRVSEVRVRVQKPAAIAAAKSAGVEIELHRTAGGPTL